MAHIPDLKAIREELGLSQAQFADMLGVSPRAIQSCEQGWRKPSAALEKAALLLLVAARQGKGLEGLACWNVVECSDELREHCWSYRSGQGHLCWLVTGNLCHGRHVRTWEEKKAVCLECSFCQQLLTRCGSTPADEAVSKAG